MRAGKFPFTILPYIASLDYSGEANFILVFLQSLATICLMTAYGKYTTPKPTPLLSHDSVKEAKETRKKLLQEIEQRRVEDYKRVFKKSRLQVNSDLL